MIEINKSRMFSTKLSSLFKYTIFACSIVLLGSGCSFNQNQIVGKWQADTGETFLFKPDNTLIMISDNEVLESGTIYDFDNQPVEIDVTYSVDYTKEPAWLDIYMRSTTENETLHSLVNFIDEDTIELINNPSGKRPQSTRSLSDESLIMKRQ